jgi:hypothetical protein
MTVSWFTAETLGALVITRHRADDSVDKPHQPHHPH